MRLSQERAMGRQSWGKAYIKTDCGFLRLTWRAFDVNDQNSRFFYDAMPALCAAPALLSTGGRRLAVFVQAAGRRRLLKLISTKALLIIFIIYGAIYDRPAKKETHYRT
jgi:hypothetical protein